MPGKTQNFIVGLFVIVGFVVLGGLIVAFGGGRTLLAKTYNMKVLFADGVSGVQGGQTVTLNGKRIGETRDLVFVDDAHLERGVKVIVSVEGLDLPYSSELIVSPPTMGLGKPIIELEVRDPSDARKLPRDGSAEIRGRMLPAIDQLVPRDMQNALVSAAKHIAELAAALTPVANNVNRILESRTVADVDTQKVAANFDTVIQRFDATLKSFNALIGDPANQKNFTELLANANKMSQAGAAAMQNVSEMSNNGKQLMQDTTQFMRKLTTTAEDMSALLKRVDEVAVAMNQKNGTVGLMLNDNRLYEELLLTMRRLSKMIDDFREVADLAKKGQLRIKAL